MSNPEMAFAAGEIEPPYAFAVDDSMPKPSNVTVDDSELPKDRYTPSVCLNISGLTILGDHGLTYLSSNLNIDPVLTVSGKIALGVLCAVNMCLLTKKILQGRSDAANKSKIAESK